jgi:AcrR family transcriptional regulator
MARPKDENLKYRILNAASSKFLRSGFSSVPVDEIVAEAGTSKAAVYNFYSSKEDLVRAVLLMLNDRINLNISRIVNNNNILFPRKLEEIIRFTSSLLKDVNTKFLEDLRVQTPAIWKEYLKLREERLNTHYIKLFNDGIQLGYIRKDVSVKFLLLVYTKLTEIAVDTSNLKNVKVTKSEAYSLISKLFLEGANP